MKALLDSLASAMKAMFALEVKAHRLRPEHSTQHLIQKPCQDHVRQVITVLMVRLILANVLQALIKIQLDSQFASLVTRATTALKLDFHCRVALATPAFTVSLDPSTLNLMISNLVAFAR